MSFGWLTKRRKRRVKMSFKFPQRRAHWKGLKLREDPRTASQSDHVIFQGGDAIYGFIKSNYVLMNSVTSCIYYMEFNFPGMTILTKININTSEFLLSEPQRYFFSASLGLNRLCFRARKRSYSGNTEVVPEPIIG